MNRIGRRNVVCLALIVAGTGMEYVFVASDSTHRLNSREYCA
jgi:hypothetical protein